jgi:hypothetical protein
MTNWRLFTLKGFWTDFIGFFEVSDAVFVNFV